MVAFSLFCKGADTVILKRLNPKSSPLEETTAHLDRMAGEGFRTLAIAQKDLSESEYNSWSHQYHLASVAVTNREEKISRMADMIETNLTLIGATAVEDKLQARTTFLAIGKCLTGGGA